MLVLAKAMLAMMIGFIISVIFGLILVPLLKRVNIKQRENIFLRGAHSEKDGTPTMGGLIFIIPTIITIICLLCLNKITFSENLFIVLFVFRNYYLYVMLLLMSTIFYNLLIYRVERRKILGYYRSSQTRTGKSVYR